MAAGIPITAETRAEILKLAGEGVGRNEIARRVELSGAAVTAVTKPAGIVFDWSSTELAVAARRVQLADIRSTLAQAALLRAWEALEDMDAPTTLVHFEAGTEHTTGGFREHLLDAPTIADRRNLATVAGILIGKAADLTKASAGVSPEAVSQLGALGEALVKVSEAYEAGQLTAGDDTDPTVPPVNVSRESLLAEFADDAEPDAG